MSDPLGLKSQLVSAGARKYTKYVGSMLNNLSNGRVSQASSPTLTNYSSKHSTENLEFPLNVSGGAAGNHGHYVMFYINAQEKSQIRTSGEGEGGSIIDSAREYNMPDYLNKWSSVKETYEKHTKKLASARRKYINADEYDALEAQTKLYGGSEKMSGFVRVSDAKQNKSNFHVKRHPTRRLKTAIAMYMPAQVQVTYGANYTDTSIGMVTAQAINAYENMLAKDYRGTAESLTNMLGSAREGILQTMLGAVGVIPGFGGTREAYEMQRGEVLTDRLELAFKGINKRNFQYTFKMIPKSQREADEVRKIVFAFKANMLPEYSGDDASGRKMIVPNTFDIQYMYNSSQNQYLHHISTCVLENMSVSYGGDRYKTFEANAEGAPPVETSITLAFKEMELITRERVVKGY